MNEELKKEVTILKQEVATLKEQISELQKSVITQKDFENAITQASYPA